MRDRVPAYYSPLQNQESRRVRVRGPQGDVLPANFQLQLREGTSNSLSQSQAQSGGALGAASKRRMSKREEGNEKCRGCQVCTKRDASQLRRTATQWEALIKQKPRALRKRDRDGGERVGGARRAKIARKVTEGE